MYNNKKKRGLATELVKAKLSNKQKKAKRGTKEYSLDDVFKLADCVTKHKEFIKFTLHHQHMVTKKIVRITSYDDMADEIILPKTKIEEKLLFKKLVLYPEAIPYLFNLEGCPKKLFLYLLLFRHQRKDEFLFSSSDIALFIQFCELYPPIYSEDTVKQAMKHLRGQNIVLNARKGFNRLNPMITGGTSDKDRIRLIHEYSFQLLQQGLNSVEGFYPK